jgi:hypothetical protein
VEESSCEDGNKHLGSTKGGEILDEQREYHLLGKNSAAQIYFVFYVEATHIELSAGQSALTTVAPTPIGLHAISDNVPPTS